MLPALREAPALPARAARRGGKRAVELGDDRPGHVHVDAADLVDQVAELGEVDHDQVVDRNGRVVGDRARGQAWPADLEGGVDLRVAVAGDLNAQVARDRQVVQPVVGRVGAQQRDRVRMLLA